MNYKFQILCLILWKRQLNITQVRAEGFKNIIGRILFLIFATRQVRIDILEFYTSLIDMKNPPDLWILHFLV